ncbi:MAG: glycosyltransferase family 4 protein [Desulfarculaceae bacterium]
MKPIPLNVAYVSLLDLPNKNAHGIQVMKNAQAWAKACQDFEFVTKLGFRNWLGFKHEEINELYGFKHPFAIKGYPLPDRFWRFSFPFMERLFHRLAVARCRQRRVEMIFTRTYLTPRYSLARGIPTVVETHAPPENRPDKLALYEQARNPLLLALVTISPELASMYRDFGLPQEKILVEPDGVDLDAFTPALDKAEARRSLNLRDDARLAVYVGHLYAGRGVEHILAAAAKLPEVDFLLVGGHDQDLQRWRAHTEAQGLKNVIFTGFVPNRLVPCYLWSADVLLMPYGKACPTADWMSPLKMFEYMAAQRPIIATDLPALSRILKHGQNAWLCPPDEPQGLTKAIDELLQQPEMAEQLGSAARDQVQQYSWDARVGRIFAFAQERWKEQIPPDAEQTLNADAL